MVSSHCSVTLKRHHSQDNFYKRKYLTAGLLTLSEFIIIMVRSMVAEILKADKNGAGVLQSYILIHRPRESICLLCSFETSEPMVSDTLPLTRTPTTPPNPSKVIKAFYSLVIKHSNIWTYGFLFNHHTWSVGDVLNPCSSQENTLKAYIQYLKNHEDLHQKYQGDSL